MKRVYVEGYDTYVRFPDEVSDEEMQKALAKHYPETDDQFVARIKDPSTQAADVSFKDFQRYKQLDTGMELLEVPGVVAQAASMAAKELYDGAKAAVNLGLQGEGGKAALSLAEGATRGTTDLVTLGRRIGEGFYQHLEPYVKETGEVEVDQYHRFLALKSLDNIRESARAGDSVLLEEFGLTPDMIDNDLAEGSSYFLDPTMVVGFGAGPISRATTRLASKPVRMAGAGLTSTAQGIRRAADRLSGLRTSATEFLDDATAGYGRYAGAGLAGAAATSAGMGPALGAAGTAFLGLPALEVAGASLSAFGDAMRLSPTRIGGLQHLALNTPDTIAGKVAGKLQFLDRPIEYLGRTAGGAAAGAGLGAGLGLLADGIEGAAQGFGAGFTSGAVGGIAGRFAEGLSGSGLRRAEINDYKNWRKQIDKPLGEYFDKYFTDHSSRTKGMDLVQLVQTAAAEKNHNVQILEPKDYDARFKNRSEGVAIPEGDAPIVYLRGVFDGKRGKDSALRLLSHEVFHAIARLDGFDVLAKRIGQDASAMYSPDEIGEFVRTYQNKLDPTKPATLTENQRNNIGEELGAEYFSDLILGKDSSYILRGDGLGAAIKHMIAKLMPGKFSRVIETFESPVFGPMKRANPALRGALNDLVTARRKAYKNVMLADGTPTVVYNEADLGDDKVYQELEALGAATTDNKGRRKMLGQSAEKRIERDRVLAVAAALDKVSASTVDAEGGGLVRQSDGSYVGKRFSPSQVEAIINEPGMPDKVIEGVQFIAGSQGLINVTYAAALAKIKRRGKKFKDKYLTRYRNLPYTNRDVAMYQIVISPKPGTMRTELLDMSFLQAKAANNWDTNQAWQTAFRNVDSMVADVKTYINALGGDVPTAQVLGSETKRNLLNKFLGVRNVKGNPLIAEDYKVKEGEHPWRSFRLDRIISMKPRNEATPTRFSRRAYEQGQMNFSPAAADVDQLGMYSKAERAIKAVKQEKGTGKQFMSALEKAGVKQEEIAETGLDKFLEDNPKTTKEDVLNHLMANQVQVNEVTKNNPGPLTDDDLAELHRLDDAYREDPQNFPDEDLMQLARIEQSFEAKTVAQLEILKAQLGGELFEASKNRSAKKQYEAAFRAYNIASARLKIAKNEPGLPRFKRYTEPGAEPYSYTERLLTMPVQAGDAGFKTYHFDEGNIVAHVRHNTRIGNFGERVLFIEEIQSDLHQAGRQKGYRSDFGEYDGPKFTAKEAKEYESLQQRQRDNYDAARALFEMRSQEKMLADPHLGSDLPVRKQLEDLIAQDKVAYQKAIDSGQSWTLADQERLEALNTARTRIDRFFEDKKKSPPDLPFKKSWPELSMKRMLRLAAEEGFDAIAWTTGATQNSRYDLSKMIDRLAYNTATKHLTGFKRAPNGQYEEVLHKSNITKQELPDYIGKERAERLLSHKSPTDIKVLDGEGMKVGGGGMEGFYDRILPGLKTWKQVKGKDGKRLKVELRGVGKALKGHYVKLTPEHRASILEQGLPRFSPGSTELTQSRSLNDRGGAIYTNERGDRAIQLSSRSGVRVYSDRGKRIGPVFSSVEKAQDFLSRN